MVIFKLLWGGFYNALFHIFIAETQTRSESETGGRKNYKTLDICSSVCLSVPRSYEIISLCLRCREMLFTCWLLRFLVDFYLFVCCCELDWICLSICWPGRYKVQIVCDFFSGHYCWIVLLALSSQIKYKLLGYKEQVGWVVSAVDASQECVWTSSEAVHCFF